MFLEDRSSRIEERVSTGGVLLMIMVIIPQYVLNHHVHLKLTLGCQLYLKTEKKKLVGLIVSNWTLGRMTHKMTECKSN